jgi:hypothetical protein
MGSFLQSLRSENESTPMPTENVTDIWIVPDVNLTDCDIENFMDERTSFVENF